ncbi:MAG TPA: ABC transporter substrate-binding protein [Stellaceae bacterium]|nr:ABC transporter substrate-binding protein [Stellaceae bacterium]
MIGAVRSFGLVMLAAALGCGPARAEMEHATLAIPGINVLFLAQHIASDLHLWEKDGLDVKVLQITGIGSMNAVIAGSADFSMSSGPSITRAWARGQKLHALATAINQSGQDIVIRKDIAEAAHFDPAAPLAARATILKGRTMAVGAVAAIPDVILKVIAKSAGIGPDEIRVAPMQPPEFMAAFARHAIDGFSNGPPYIQQALLDGSGVLVSDSTKGEPAEYSPVSAALLLARADFCDGHKSICAKMVHGIVAATRFIHEHPRQSLAVMKARYPTLDARVLEAAYEMVRAMSGNPPITSPKMLENSDDLNVRAGFIKPEEKLARYDELIDNSYVK